MLFFNGEIFHFLGPVTLKFVSVAEFDVTGCKNDGTQLFEILDLASQRAKEQSREDYVSEILEVMSTVFGGNDVAFAFLDAVNGLVITYRDMFGKRSLLLAGNESEIAITSVPLSGE